MLILPERLGICPDHVSMLRRCTTGIFFVLGALIPQVLARSQQPPDFTVDRLPFQAQQAAPRLVEPESPDSVVGAVPGSDSPLMELERREPVVIAEMEFVPIPAGEFSMGSASENSDDDEQPVMWVRISSAFLLGKYEVTQSEWESVMGRNPSRFPGCPRCPMENVTWKAVQKFIRKLNKQQSGEEYRFRLPPEAEWEYASRAGSTGDRYGADLDLIAWHRGNSGGRTHPVGQKKPNGFGLHDMLGNVWELLQDRYGKYPGGAVTDPTGPDSGWEQVVRGGSWSGDDRQCRLSTRGRVYRNWNALNQGFRLVVTAQ